MCGIVLFGPLLLIFCIVYQTFGKVYSIYCCGLNLIGTIWNPDIYKSVVDDWCYSLTAWVIIRDILNLRLHSSKYRWIYSNNFK